MVKATDEESKHFNLICDCFEKHRIFYGVMPDHAGKCRVVKNTASDFLGRLAIIPMVLEALSLEVTLSVI